MKKITDIVFIQPPFASVTNPSMGLSLLQAELTEKGIKSKIYYSNFILAKLIGESFYEDICHISGRNIIAEYIFAEVAYPKEQFETNFDAKTIKNKFGTNKYFASKTDRVFCIEDIFSVQRYIPKFLDEVLQYIESENPIIVGISSIYQQTTASIAIANAIKKYRPEIHIVFGGGNCLTPMGKALKNTTDSIDFIFSGEADIEFPNFCATLIKSKNIFTIDGPREQLLNKNDGIIDCAAISNINILPFPNYDDFIAQRKFQNIKSEYSLCFESTRGCWWSYQSHCLFCGVNGPNHKFRMKDPERMKNELIFLNEKYNPRHLYAADNIMPKIYPKKIFRSFKFPQDVNSVFIEAKIPISFKNLFYLKRAGINNIQPGIESLNDHLLKLLRKGTTVAENIVFLRDCRDLGINVWWNMLYSIVGESVEDYQEMMKLIPWIYHLQPPQNIGAIRIQRFSPLFEESEKLNIKNIRPLEMYGDIFPISTDLENLAIFFEGDFPTAFSDKKLENTFIQTTKDWQQSWKISSELPILSLLHLNDENLMVHDSRPRARSVFNFLDQKHYRILDRLRLPQTKSSLVKWIELNDLEDEFLYLSNMKYVLTIADNVISIVNESIREIKLNKSI